MSAVAERPESRRARRPQRTPPPRWRRALRHPLAHLVAALALIALVQAFAVKVYQVPSDSMSPTLGPGDRIVVDRVTTATASPKLGDVIVFERPANWRDEPRDAVAPWRTAVGWIGDTFGFGPTNTDALVKRVVALPGDSLGCCDDTGRMLRNGEPLTEPYVADDLPFDTCAPDAPSQRCFAPIVLGDDEYLVAGDHRAVSVDSLSGCRGSTASDAPCARTVSRDDIIGIAFLRFWPLSSWGGVGGG